MARMLTSLYASVAILPDIASNRKPLLLILIKKRRWGDWMLMLAPIDLGLFLSHFAHHSLENKKLL